MAISSTLALNQAEKIDSIDRYRILARKMVWRVLLIDLRLERGVER